MFAKVTSALALFVVLGGVAWAAAVPENSVGTKQLKDWAVTLPKIAPGARDRLACRPAQRGCRGPAGSNAVPFLPLEANPSSAPPRPLATVGPYRLTYRCSTSEGKVLAVIGIKGPDAFFQVTRNTHNTSAGGFSMRVASGSVPTLVLASAFGDGVYEGLQNGTAFIDWGGAKIVKVNFAVYADEERNVCTFSGDGFVAS